MQEFVLPKLPYDYAALEPVISREIMMLHYEKHHQGYVNNFNSSVKDFLKAKESNDIVKMTSLQKNLNFNGGGHLNHSLFWQMLTPNSTSLNEGIFLKNIEKTWGSMDFFKKKFSEVAVSIQGSGWSWLGFSKLNNSLMICVTANQDPLEGTQNIFPIFGLDVWEHAYYLQYKNNRADYVKAIWQIVNWNFLEERFNKVISEEN